MTTAQLRAVGWSARVISARVRQGRLHPVFAEVYSLGGPPQSDRERWMAAVLTYGERTRLSHSACAELRGWLRFPLGALHVTTPTKRRPRDGIRPHHRPQAVVAQHIEGIPVTGPEETVLDCATCVASDRAYRRIVRQAQVDETTTHARLLAFAAQHPGARGVARLKAELAEGPSPTRSAFEDEVLELFRTGGQPVPNAIVEGEEVDLYFPALGVAIEVDGAPHDNPTARADDAAKQARLAERGVRVLRLR